MRVDIDFSAKLTAPFLIGDTELLTDPVITDLGLAPGEWWFGVITDELCEYSIKVENIAGEYVITQGECGSTACDANIGACLDPSPCGDCCDALNDESDCDIDSILSDDLDITVDPENCKEVTINIKEGVIPVVPDFCDLDPENMVVNINGNSVLFFCENGQKFGINFSDLCADLGACSEGDITINNITNEVIPASDVDSTQCGMVIEQGVITSITPNWCDQFATDAELAAEIATIDAQLFTLSGTAPITVSGGAVKTVELNAIFGANQAFFGGALTTDKYGRVTFATAATPWITGISSGDTFINVAGTVITHNDAITPVFTSSSGLEVDAKGHIVSQLPGYQIVRWSGNTTAPVTHSQSTNVVIVNVAGDLVFTFNTPMSDAFYYVGVHKPNGHAFSAGADIITAKTQNGFTIPAGHPDMVLFIHE